MGYQYGCCGQDLMLTDYMMFLRRKAQLGLQLQLIHLNRSNNCSSWVQSCTSSTFQISVNDSKEENYRVSVYRLLL